MARQPKYDEKKYNAAINTLAEQLVAIVRKDYPGENPGKYIEDYTADVYQDIDAAIKALIDE